MYSKFLVTLDNPNSQVSEQYRRIRTNIEFSSIDHKLKVINVTSSISNESKTTTSCNLAIMFANKLNRVLLIDADLRNASVHKVLGLKQDIGLTDLIIEYVHSDGNFEGIDINKYTTSFEHEKIINQLDILSAGSHVNNPAEFIGSKAFKNVINNLAKNYDLVIIDSAPSGFIVDGLLASAACDGTVFVIDYGRIKFDLVKSTLKTLKNSGVNIIGSIISRSPIRNDYFSRYYNESYYYTAKERK